MTDRRSSIARLFILIAGIDVQIAVDNIIANFSFAAYRISRLSDGCQTHHNLLLFLSFCAFLVGKR